MYKSLSKLLVVITLFGAGVVNAEIQIGTSGRNSGVHTGYIYCPNNEKITHFELAFDSSSASRDNVPYNMIINGDVIYSNQTPSSPVTSGYNTYATTTPVSHDPVDCFGQATWTASSTSPTGEQMRIMYTNINTGSLIVTPNYTFSPPDRLATLYIASNPTDQNLIGSKIRFANSVYYLATSTSSGGGGTPTTIDVTTENDSLINFAILFAILLAMIFSIIHLLRPFYARK